VWACAVGAGTLLLDAIFGEVIPPLALEAAGGFAFGPFYSASLVANRKPIRYGPVSCVSIVDR
jgi:hypothetical protein